MQALRLYCFIAALTLVSACAATRDSDKATTAAQTAEATSLAEPALISQLPERVGSFDYQGYKHFEKADAGYTVRYANTQKKRMADIYIYPVADENRNLAHNQLVMGSTRATLKAIGQAVNRGVYANFNVIGAATHARGTRTVARVQTTYLRRNLASYSVLYQTEHEGTLVKIRVTMPDNEFNRSSTEWDRFALQMVDLVIRNLDSEQRNATSERPSSV